MPTTYQYGKKGGGVGTIEAEDDAAAQALASSMPDAEPTTGVARVTAPADSTTIADAYKDLTVGAPEAGDPILASAMKDAGALATGKLPTAEDLYKEKVKLYQGEIDATNQIYAEMLEKAKIQSRNNLGSGRAIQARSGLLGSDFATAQTRKIVDSNTAAENAILAEKAGKIATITSRAREGAEAELLAKREAQRQGTKDYLEYLASANERKAAKLTTLATSILDQDLTLEDIDPKQLKKIARDYGLAVGDITTAVLAEKKVRDAAAAEADAKARKDLSFNLSEGQDYYEYDPKTGKYTQIASKGKTYAPKAGGDGSGGGGGEADAALYDGLSSKTATAVRSKVTAFKGEPSVQNFATVQEGNNFASSIAGDTTNPADDQALIYALAKALDPGSVVREGEYATAQKYAQSWIAAYGTGVQQALLGTGFLSKKARENIKNTIKTKYDASKKTYDNLYKQYSTGVNALTGRSDGSRFLIDYATPVDGGGADNAPGSIVEIDGVQYEVGGDGDTLNPVQ